MEAPAQTPSTSRQPVYALHLPRLILRCVALLFLFLSLCLIIADGVSCVKDVTEYSSNPDSSFSSVVATEYCWTAPLTGDIRPLIFVIFALIWNCAELITIVVNRKGINPLVSLVLDIVIVLGLVSQAGVGFWQVREGFSVYDRYTAGIVFLFFASFLHLTLFVLEIICVRRWRRARYGDSNYGSSGYGRPPTYQQAYIPPLVYQQPQVGQYANLPPPPPGMVYLVPVQGGQMPMLAAQATSTRGQTRGGNAQIGNAGLAEQQKETSN